MLLKSRIYTCTFALKVKCIKQIRFCQHCCSTNNYAFAVVAEVFELIFNWKSIQRSCTFVVSLLIASFYQQVRDFLSKPTNRCVFSSFFSVRRNFLDSTACSLERKRGEATLRCMLKCCTGFENFREAFELIFVFFPLFSCTEPVSFSKNREKQKRVQ